MLKKLQIIESSFEYFWKASNDVKSIENSTNNWKCCWKSFWTLFQWKAYKVHFFYQLKFPWKLKAFEFGLTMKLNFFSKSLVNFWKASNLNWSWKMQCSDLKAFYMENLGFLSEKAFRSSKKLLNFFQRHKIKA